MGGAFPGRLPPRMRAAAVASAVLWLAFATVVAVRAGLALPRWRGTSRRPSWLVVAVTQLPPDALHALDAYWRAANYLSVGQIYLRGNALLREPLTLAHVKPRLLGHWGTTPGLNFVYAHMNRAIRAHDLNAIFVAGPGHGGPGVVANTYLESTYREGIVTLTPAPDMRAPSRGSTRSRRSRAGSR